MGDKQSQTRKSQIEKDEKMMKYDLELNLPYALLTIFALAVFYGIYFAKVFAQKQRGIKTCQIGRRKEKYILFARCSVYEG